MRGKAPVVRECMTHLPVEAEKCQTVSDAVSLMHQNHIHHLPVMSGSHLKGIVSLHDLLQHRVEHAGSAESMLLEEICTGDLLKVGPLTPVNEVAKRMLDRKIDCAVVVDGGFVVGLFTSTDALRILDELFG